MAGFTPARQNSLLDALLGAVALTVPGTVYVGLATNTVAPAVTGADLTEVTGGAYVRTPVPNTAANFPASTVAGGVSTKANGNAVGFPQATAAWGTVTYFVIYDAQTVGNVIGFGALTTPKAITTGDTASFAAGNLKVTLTAS